MRKQNLMLFPPEIAAEFVAEQEGFEPMAYKCPTGHWTIGFGHARNVHEGDIVTRREAYDLLKLDIVKLANERNGGKPIKVVANLPYYITTPIIMGLFESHVPLDSITIMVQKEVADRMQVGPGTKDYGALSLAVQYYAKPQILLNVPASCFMPRPNVDSAVIQLTRYEKPPVEVKDEHLMFRLIRASFNQRRKTMTNSVGNSPELSVSKEQMAAVLEKCGLSATVRGEALTLEQFAELANVLSEDTGK